MRRLIPLIVMLALCCATAFAADPDSLPANFLSSTHPIHNVNAVLRSHTKQGNFPTPHGFPQGIDTIVNFTHQFEAQGVNFDGTAHHMWEYSMVGNDPARGGTTTYNAPVVPVSLDMLNADGSQRFVKLVNGAAVTCGNPPEAGCQPLVYDVTPFIPPFMGSPVFQPAPYSSSPQPTQITDAVQRAEFGAHARADWHTLLNPSVKPTRTMVLPKGTYFFAVNSDGSCCAFVLVDIGAFVQRLFPQTPTPDNSTIIGSAEVAGDMTTKDISTFLFPNTYLFFNGDPNNCCVLGFHSFDVEPGDATNGNQTRVFVMNYSSWISPGLFNGGVQDVTAHSHEIAETFNDPFVAFDGKHNVTPFWQNPAGQCQDVLEDGDVIEDLPNPVFPVTLNGFTYHPQNEALLPWFEFEKNSSAIDNAYSYPDESVLTTLSDPQPLNCGQK